LQWWQGKHSDCAARGKKETFPVFQKKNGLTEREGQVVLVAGGKNTPLQSLVMENSTPTGAKRGKKRKGGLVAGGKRGPWKGRPPSGKEPRILPPTKKSVEAGGCEVPAVFARERRRGGEGGLLCPGEAASTKGGGVVGVLLGGGGKGRCWFTWLVGRQGVPCGTKERLAPPGVFLNQKEKKKRGGGGGEGGHFHSCAGGELTKKNLERLKDEVP